MQKWQGNASGLAGSQFSEVLSNLPVRASRMASPPLPPPTKHVEQGSPPEAGKGWQARRRGTVAPSRVAAPRVRVRGLDRFDARTAILA
eukprot:1378103-Alexandrium_andersonii.AAC.1